MEVVSPKLDTTMPVSSILSDFWEAMHVHFDHQKDTSCGGHVHVTPVSLNNKFALRSLKKIAFATVIYEDFITAMLPLSRRENQYCKVNSQSIDAGLHDTLACGKNATSLKKVATEIKRKANEVELYLYMQGNRYVLWNFQNIFPSPKTGRCTGTVEFRGGNQFLGTRGTMAWVAFVLAFITLALQEVSLIGAVVAYLLNHKIIRQITNMEFATRIFYILQQSMYRQRTLDSRIDAKNGGRG